MSLTIDEAQALCTTTEWNTVQTSFSPKLEQIPAAVAKKQANRIQRFLDKCEDSKKQQLFKEALERLKAKAPERDNAESDSRREKEKAARAKAKEARGRLLDVRTKLKEKAEEEKAAKEGEGGADGGKSLDHTGKPKKAGKHSQGRIGTRKV